MKIDRHKSIYFVYKVHLPLLPSWKHAYPDLSFTGHPEFVPDIVKKIVDAREKSGAMDAATVKEGRERAIRPDDGTGIIARTIWKILGVESNTEIQR